MNSIPHWNGLSRHGTMIAAVAGFLCTGALMAWANQVTYQVNLGVQRALGNFNPANGDTVIVSGTFSTTDWTTTSVLSPSGGDSNIYTGTFNNNVATGGTENHKFIINPGGNSGAGQLIWESGNNRFFLVTAGNQTLPVVYFDNVTNAPTPPTNNYTPTDFIAGADLSHLQFFEDRGISYHVNGQVQDALMILKNRGINCVRLRLFTSSAAQAQADPYNYTNNLAYTLPLAVRVKNAGLQFLLDFHYSDTWADPGKQAKPNAWTNLSFNELEQQMYDYNSNTIAAFKAAGALPEYVQIGNEITHGMLWPDGRVSGSSNTAWSNLGRLMKAAINGIKDAAGTNPPKIIIHIDGGGDWPTTQWYFDNVVYQNVPFDIIGESYYPWWHGDLNALSNCLNNAAQRYNKPVIVAETAFPWTNTVPASYNPNLGIPLTPAGQVEYTLALASIVKGVSCGRGIGIFWWGTEYVQLSGYNLANFHRTSLFNYGGNTLPVAAAYGQLAAPVEIAAALNGSGLSLKWPYSGAAMSLKTATSLSPPAAWSPVTNAVQSTGGIFSTTLPLGEEQRFYLLQTN